MNPTSTPTTTQEPARWHRPLTGAAIAFGALTAFALAAVLIDDRTLMGEPVWLKVLKFAFAFTAYSLTLAWLIGRMTKARRFAWWTGTVFATLSIIEVGMLVMAATLGTYSHFNGSDDLPNQILQNSFSIGIPVMFMANVAIAVTVLFQRIGDRATTAVIRWGLLLSTAGMLTAFLLVNLENEGRIVEDAYGNEVELGGAHGIGGDPDGNGMPLTGWSTSSGDLRVPHFFGLHGIQILIMAAIVIGALAMRYARLRDEKVRARLVHAAALGYTGLFATTIWQASRGQSFASPDAATLAAFAASAAVSLAIIAATAVRARKRPAPAGSTPESYTREASADPDDWEPAVPLR